MWPLDTLWPAITVWLQSTWQISWRALLNIPVKLFPRCKKDVHEDYILMSSILRHFNRSSTFIRLSLDLIMVIKTVSVMWKCYHKFLQFWVFIVTFWATFWGTERPVVLAHLCIDTFSGSVMWLPGYYLCNWIFCNIKTSAVIQDQ